MEKKEQDLVKQLVDEKVKEIGGFVVDLNISKSKIMVLIDKMTGLTIDDCYNVSRSLRDSLDTTGILETHEVEVSSPGADKPFKVLEQYYKYKGWKVKVISNGTKEISGLLEDINDKEITLKETVIEKVKKKKHVKEVISTIPFNEIKETKLVLTK